jgi:hypothetical protein
MSYVANKIDFMKCYKLIDQATNIQHLFRDLQTIWIHDYFMNVINWCYANNKVTKYWIKLETKSIILEQQYYLPMLN